MFCRVSSLLLVVGLLGFLSMGYQMVASRLLAPCFGTSLIVWAFLISTFLAAFSVGSIAGGWISSLRHRARRVGLLLVGLCAVAGFAVDALAGRAILDAIDASISNTNAGLLLACCSLFLAPVLALSAYSPLCADRLAAGGMRSGLATGLVYGVSTLGNIAGVMVTSFVLIPRFGISSLLMLWLVLAAIDVLLLERLLWRSDETSSGSPAHCGK